jgi:biopolymer transport protein ExbB
VYDLVLKENLEEAIAACNARKTAIARLLESALQNALKHRNGTSKADTTVEQAMTTTWQSILPHLEKNTYLLSTIAAIAPMLGFLGTVLGMIKAFYSLSTTTTVVPQQLLAGGIYEAMITTAAGLIVGLIAEVALRYCITRINTTAKRIDQIAYHLVAILNLS